MSPRWWIYGVFLVLIFGNASCLTDSHGNELWEPEDGTPRDEWILCRGLPCNMWLSRQKKMMELKAMEMPPEDEDYYDYVQKAVKNPEALLPETIMNLDYDESELPTEEEIEDNIASEREGLGKDHVRKKRRFHGDFSEEELKWDMPVHYKFDGTYDPEDIEKIKKAIRHIEANTCIRFKELKLKQTINKPYVIFIKEYERCHSWVGRQKIMKVQPINVQEQCLDSLGEVVHEILHALGMWNEEQRTDRDNFVRINYENMKNSRSQFTKKVDTQSMNLPYDYGSVMHSAPKDMSKNMKYVIEPRNPDDILMRHNMGQRTGLSFYDHQLLNKAYCYDSCKNKAMAKQCEHGGYQNPNDCSKCKCPNAYAGQFCEKLHPSNARCGGELFVDSVETISTPNWPTGHYQNRMSCTWRFTSAETTRLQFEFEGPFSLLSMNKGVCYHWVEVLYRGSLDTPGPRFCGSYRPTAKLVSDSNEMIVMLRSNYTAEAIGERGGFKAKITVLKDEL